MICASVPHWELPLSLKALVGDPNESLEFPSLKALSPKTKGFAAYSESSEESK